MRNDLGNPAPTLIKLSLSSAPVAPVKKETFLEHIEGIFKSAGTEAVLRKIAGAIDEGAIVTIETLEATVNTTVEAYMKSNPLTAAIEPFVATELSALEAKLNARIEALEAKLTPKT